MPAVVVALVLLALLIAVGLAFGWQETGAVPEGVVVYGVEDALEFVYPRLSDAARGALTRNEVRRILEWEVKYLQNPRLREGAGEPTVVGGINAARYAQEQLIASGLPYDGPIILEVLERQSEYLAALGAVGDAVAGEELRTVLRKSGEDPDA